MQLHAAQSLTMTPQLQQSLRLLQLPALEFEQEIDRALAENPFLERDEEAASATAPAEEPIASDAADGAASEADPVSTPEVLSPEDLHGEWSGGSSANSASHIDAGVYTAAPVSLRDHLVDQLSGSGLAARERLLAELVVEALDDDGYLRQSLAEVGALLPGDSAAEDDELAVALRFVQSLDPAGVGARSPAECLELQLLRHPADMQGRDLALAIVREHLDTLAAHDTPRLLQALGCDEAAFRDANGLILRLDPHPGSRFGTPDARFVVADVVVRKVHGRWLPRINPQVLPRIRVNELYADIYRGSHEANPGLSQQLQEARWLIRNTQQRFQTIQRVAQAIVDRQRRFFDHGDVAMKPLLQRDIAREVGVHESTVSRVASGKYMTTPRGLIEFKHFFGTHVLAEDGHACSSTAIRALIRQIIANERAGEPLSDIKVTRRLDEFGVRVARRTVTKYRDAMRIPPVEARRLSQPRRGRPDSVSPRS